MKNQVKISKVLKPFKKQIKVNSDKSLSIRTVLLASVANGKSKITDLLEAEDVLNALKTIKKLGGVIICEHNTFFSVSIVLILTRSYLNS